MRRTDPVWREIHATTWRCASYAWALRWMERHGAMRRGDRHRTSYKRIMLDALRSHECGLVAALQARGVCPDDVIQIRREKRRPVPPIEIQGWEIEPTRASELRSTR